MSHYSSVKTKIKHKDHLVSALKKINKKWANCIEVHEEATHLYGYQGDKRQTKANIIIRRKDVGSASNDIGFIKTEDGSYQAIISEFDSSTHNKEWLDKLSQLYSVEVVQATAKINGFSFSMTEENNEIHIICEKD